MRQPSPFPTRRKGPGDKVLSGRLKGLEARGAVQTGAAGVSQSQFDVISIIMPEPLSQAATHDAAREREEPSATDAPHESNPSRSLIMDKLERIVALGGVARGTAREVAVVRRSARSGEGMSSVRRLIH